MAAARKARPPHAPPADVEAEREFAAGMAAHQLHCRELGHSWGAYTAKWDTETGTYDRVLQCSSCLATRHQVLDSEGFIVTNGRYKYEPGYLAKDVVGYVGGQVPRNIFRLEAVQRVAVKPPRRRARKRNGLKAVT